MEKFEITMNEIKDSKCNEEGCSLDLGIMSYTFPLTNDEESDNTTE